jgi:hypothetical protein
MNTDTTRARFDAAFQQIAEVMRKETHNDASIFRVVADSIPHNPHFACSLAFNVAVVLDGHADGVDYTDVLVEAFRRTVFPVGAEGEHTEDYFDGDPAKAEELARSITLHAGLGDTCLIRAAASKYLN